MEKSASFIDGYALSGLHSLRSFIGRVFNLRPGDFARGLPLFAYYLLIVTFYQMARLARVSFGKAAAWVFGIWGAYTAFFWGLGMVGQLVSKRMSGS